MPTRKELQELAKLRLKEAEHLYKQGLYDGCVYLCGYVVEFALKARICRVLKLDKYPDEGRFSELFKKHDFELLRRLAGLEQSKDLSKGTALGTNWSIATEWSPERRYTPAGTANRRKAEDVLASLKDRPNGVLTWLAKKW